MILDTPNQIATFHLLAQRRSLALEATGIRFKKSVLAHCKHVYQFPDYADHEDVVAWLTRVIEYRDGNSAARFIGTA